MIRGNTVNPVPVADNRAVVDDSTAGPVAAIFAVQVLD